MHPGRYNMALVRRAIREDWPIPPAVRAMVVNQMALVVGRGEDERNRIAASKVLVAADAVNAKREGMDQADEHKQLPDLHAHLHMDPAALERYTETLGLKRSPIAAALSEGAAHDNGRP